MYLILGVRNQYTDSNAGITINTIEQYKKCGKKKKE